MQYLHAHVDQVSMLAWPL